MAAVDHYTITATDITMADFPSKEPSPFDLSDYDLLDQGPVECPMPSSTGQFPTEGLFSPAVEVGNITSSHSASYVDSGSSGGGDGSSSSTRQVNRVLVTVMSWICFFSLLEMRALSWNVGRGCQSGEARKWGHIGLRSGRNPRWRSWMMDSSGGSTERSQSKTAQILGTLHYIFCFLGVHCSLH